MCCPVLLGQLEGCAYYHEVTKDKIYPMCAAVKNYLQAEMPAVTTQESVLQF